MIISVAMVVVLGIVLGFHQLGPLGPVGLVVTKSVCPGVIPTVFVPFPCDFSRGLSLAL